MGATRGLCGLFSSCLSGGKVNEGQLGHYLEESQGIHLGKAVPVDNVKGKTKPSQEVGSEKEPFLPSEPLFASLEQQKPKVVRGSSLGWSANHNSHATFATSVADIEGTSPRGSLDLQRQRQERVLRALLSKARSVTALLAPPPAVSTQQPLTETSLTDAELVQFQGQLMQLCSSQRPGPEVLHKLSQLVGNIKQWLFKHPGDTGSMAILYVVGEALAHVEHTVRSTGQVQYWSQESVSLLLSLLQLFAAMMQTAKQPLLCTTLARLVLRPALLDLLIGVLELLHFSARYKGLCERHEQLGEALQVWEFLKLLVRFGAAHGGASGKLPECLARLGAMLDPSAPSGGSGVVPRLLSQPLSEETVVLQLHIMRLLKAVYDLRDQGRLLQQLPHVAEHYVQYHFGQMSHYCTSAAGDTSSAAAELCRIHLEALRSLTRHVSSSPAIRQAFQQQHVLEFLVEQLSLEAKLLSTQGAVSEPDHDGETGGHSQSDGDGSDSDDSVALSSHAGHRRGGSGDGDGNRQAPATPHLAPPCEAATSAKAKLSGTSGSGRLPPLKRGDDSFPKAAAATADGSVAAGTETQQQQQPSGPQAPPPTPSKFQYTYDLNEDLERLMALEAQLGTSVDLEGLPEDTQAVKEAEQRMEQRRSEEVTAAARAGEETGASSFARSSKGMSDTGCWSGHGPEGTSSVPSTARSGRPPIPRLALVGLRNGSITQSSSTPSTTTGAQGVGLQGTRLFPPPLAIPTSGRSNSPLRPPAPGSVDTNPGFVSARQRSMLHHTHLSPLSDHPASSVTSPAAHAPTPCRLSHTSSARFGILHQLPAVPRTPQSAPLSQSQAFMVDSLPVSIDPSTVTDESAGTSDESNAPKQQPALPGPAEEPSFMRLAAELQQEAQDSVPDLKPRVPALNLSNLKLVDDKSSGSNRAINSLHAGSSVMALSSGKVLDSAMESRAGTVAASSCSGPVSYLGATRHRLLYADPSLHAMALTMALELMLTPSGGLDPAYFVPYPGEVGLPNIEHAMLWHLNSEAGAAVLPELLKAFSSPAPGAAAVAGGAQAGAVAGPKSSRAAGACLLRLLCRGLLDSTRYTNLQFQTRGAYGGIFRAKMLPPVAHESALSSGQPTLQQQQQPTQVMIKTLDIPPSSYERCVLQDVYAEVALLERYRGLPGICQLIDYGVVGDAYWIVMKRYRCALSEWRARQRPGLGGPRSVAAYLHVLLQITEALKLLAHDHVVHFDLKCANVLVDPLPGTTDTQLWAQLDSAPPAQVSSSSLAGQSASSSESPWHAPFSIALADFGEARAYQSADEAFTARNRGTEAYKSPEMLLMNVGAGRTPLGASAPASPGSSGAARGHGSSRAPCTPQKVVSMRGAGHASDIWSLGCLAYELMAGVVLFDGDYATVTHRVAFGSGPNLTLTAAERVKLGDRQQLVDLVEWILARDPTRRPGLSEIQARVEQIRQAVIEEGSRKL